MISALIPGSRAILAALAFIIAGTIAPTVTLALDEADKAQVETIIREYLLANPGLMVEVQQALEEKQKAETALLQKQTLAEMSNQIYNSKHQVSIGDPDAPITVVEFYDYNCGFCQRALSDMNKFIKEDKNVRFILKEFPVLGEQSLEAHRVSLAFNQLVPEKAAEFHAKLLGMRGRKNGVSAAELALTYGIDADTLKAETEKPYVMEAIREVYEMADGLGITGTPSYVIGDEVIFGAVGYDLLKEKVDKIITN